MSTQETYTFTNVTGNHTISASFARITLACSIFAQAGSSDKGQVRYKVNDGSWTTISNLSTSTSVTINVGDSITVEAVNPVSGYRFKRWTVIYSESSVTEYKTSNPYTESSISEVVDIGVEFEVIPTHTITATASAGGSITPSGSVSVLEGSDQAFVIEADSGYEISHIYVDGSSVYP